MIFSETYKQKIKEAFTLALPIIAGQLGQVLMGFFDGVQIGGLGSTYIAAAGFANTIYWTVNLLGLGILFAISPLVSEAFGEKKNYKAIGIFRSGVKASIVVSIVFTVIMFIITANLEIFKESETVNSLAARYLNVLNFSTLFMLLFTAAKQFMDGMGRTKIGMYVTLSGLLLNVFLNWVLIYGNLGASALGIEGTALATSVSRVLMTVAILVFIWRDKQIMKLREEYGNSEIKNESYIMPIIRIGVPAGLQFFWEVAAFGAALIMSGWLGEQYLASHQIAISLASVTFMVLTGIAAAGTIMTGFSYGAKDIEGIKAAGNTILVLTLFIELIFAVLFLVLKNFLPLLYTDDAEVISIASAMLVFAAFFQLSDGFQAAAAGALRGIQDVTVPAIIAFISYWLIMVPLCYVLAFNFHLGLSGIWIGFIVGLTIAAVLQIGRFKLRVRSIIFKEL